MDPLSHVVTGRAVVVLLDRHGRVGPGAGAAAILGALSPDADVALAPLGWDVYLRAHEIGAHSIAGALVMAFATAAVIRALTRGARFSGLWAAASAAALSHVALDVMSGARIRVAWPLVDWRPMLPLVAMADPWIVAISAAGALGFWTSRRPRRTPALLLLGAMLVVFSFKGALLARVPVPDPSAIVEARWGSLTEWNVFDQEADTLHAWRVDARDGRAALLWSWLLTPESALMARSRSLDTVRNFLRVHELGFPIERAEGSGRTGVFWSDIRFCSPPPPDRAAIACELWFGGVFGPDGRALTQEVKIGAWIQTRSAPP